MTAEETDTKPTFRSLEVRSFHDDGDATMIALAAVMAPVEPATERPFDLQSCLDKIRRSVPWRHNGRIGFWNEGWYNRPGVLGKQEAHFWLRACSLVVLHHESSGPDGWLADLRAEVESGAITGQLDRTSLLEVYAKLVEDFGKHWRIRERIGWLVPQLLRALAGPDGALGLAIEVTRWEAGCREFVDALGPTTLGSEGAAEEEAMRRVAQDALASVVLDADNVSGVLAILTRTRPQDLLVRTLASLLDERGTTRAFFVHLHDAIHAVADDELYESMLESSPSELLARDLIRLVRRRGFAPLAWVLPRVIVQKRIDSAVSAVLLSLHDRALVPLMLELSTRRRKGPALELAQRAQQWLLDEGANAIVGLLDVVANKGDHREDALRLLRTLHDRGGERMLRDAVAALADKQRAKVLEQLRLDLTPEHLGHADVTSHPTSTTAAFLSPSAYPILRTVEGEMVPKEITASLVHLIARTDLTTGEAREPFDRIRELVARLEPSSYAALAEHLVEGFLKGGLKASDGWVYWALAHVGNARIVHLADSLHDRSSEAARQPGANAVWAMKRCGSNESIWKLSTMLLTSAWAHPSLAASAQQALTMLAAERGTNMDDLVEASAPSFGLDAQATKVLDFGPRRMIVRVVGVDEVVIRQENGHVYKAFPSARGKDDRAKVEEARREFKALSAGVRTFSASRRATLEPHLRSRRTWTLSRWRSWYVEHPLNSLYARSLVWGVLDTRGTTTTTFRATEDGSLTDAHDNTLTLEDNATIRLVHPLDLSADELARWRTLLDDYHVIQPIEQVMRRVFTADHPFLATLEGSEIKWAADPRIHPGWAQQPSHSAATKFGRPFAGGCLTFEVVRNPSSRRPWPVITRFAAFRDDAHDQGHTEIPLSAVDPFVLSEGALDLVQAIEDATG